jgi:S1-C subfamily serine protease
MPEDELGDRLRRSVVKLFTVIKEPNYYQPWEHAYQHTSGGSACILPGQRILTNAHVVTHQLHVQALKPGDSKKYSARVLHIDHESETALLTVDDPRFFDDTVPVTLGTLPPRNAKVRVYGFPTGGNELCVTAGVVSRLEVSTYTHSQRNLLALQTDAAINPGNSGGPVFMDGELVGLAFQSYRRKDLEKAGYVIPVPVIRHFLEDLENGRLDGVPDLGVYVQKLENAALREYYGLTGEQTGVRVSRVLHGSSADGVLQVDDVLTAIDSVPVASDGTVPLRDHERVHFSHLIDGHQVGDVASIDLIRAGKPHAVSLPLRRYVAMVAPPTYPTRPGYFIFAGLVFIVLSSELLGDWEWAEKHHRFGYFKHEMFPTEARREIVLIGQVLAHEINLGYHQVVGAMVERINGIPISALRDVPGAFATPRDGFHVIETDYHGPRTASSDYHSAHGTRIVFRASEATQATAEILVQHGVARDRALD